ncbi:sensor histidine kinase [Streptomyces yaizuensis]|uniref:histidine kinase n=1 Tax=Streptomyces yaizuensis TaxID=2989713 RepID=A0ABQ5NRG5_9ACTN|nr:HAMP domain-containing sensor histidine kinase [Streptomyces sp. YSPA8]GLF92956.1 HAMP domain-containing protein [Streptomyces sp. YSPA8]
MNTVNGPGAAPDRRRPASLRRRLTWGVTLLVTAVVLAVETITFVSLRYWLLESVDRSLTSFCPPEPAFRDAASGRGFPSYVTSPGVLPADFRIHFYGTDGRLLTDAIAEGTAPGPSLPPTSDALVAQGPAAGGEHLASVPAVSGDGSWRTIVRPGPDGMRAVVSLPLDPVRNTLRTMLLADAALLLLTAAGALAGARWVVRLGLLPLTRMERAAQQITVGNLDLRLPDTDERTETGRLGSVLNTMLDQLQSALREREASEARLRRFLDDMGHELRTPLTAVQGFAELALRHEQQSAEANRLITQNAARMSLLVDDMQLLARLDQQPTYRAEPVDLLSLAADAVGATAVGSPSRDISLDPLRPGSELDVVETPGDPHRLRQVIDNLLSNACRHTPPATPVAVRVGRTRTAPDTGGVNAPHRASPTPPLPPGVPVCVLEVADEGAGLSAEDAHQVFDRFYRADPSRSRDRGGSGLGLSIAATIAQGHGGRLELDTGSGRGCTFRVLLPILRTGGDPGPGAGLDG